MPSSFSNLVTYWRAFPWRFQPSSYASLAYSSNGKLTFVLLQTDTARSPSKVEIKGEAGIWKEGHTGGAHSRSSLKPLSVSFETSFLCISSVTKRLMLLALKLCSYSPWALRTLGTLFTDWLFRPLDKVLGLSSDVTATPSPPGLSYWLIHVVQMKVITHYAFSCWNILEVRLDIVVCSAFSVEMRLLSYNLWGFWIYGMC